LLSSAIPALMLRDLFSILIGQQALVFRETHA